MKEPLTLKQHERSEKKKRKLAALANLMQLNLNDRDRLQMAKRKQREVLEQDQEQIKVTHQPSISNMEDDGFTKVSYKRKPRNKQKPAVPVDKPEDEPESKRSRSESTLDGNLVAESINLTIDQYKDLKNALEKKRRQLANVPHFRLREMGMKASLCVPDQLRTPLFLTDIQHLLMATLIGRKCPYVPERWCTIDKWPNISHCVVVVLEGLSIFHYRANENRFARTNEIFDTKVEVLLPTSRSAGGIIEELLHVSLTNAQVDQLIEAHGSLESALELNKNPTAFVNRLFPMLDDNFAQSACNSEELHPDDKFPRTKLLLSVVQMVDEGYPLPLQGAMHEQYRSYAYTKMVYKPVTNKSPMFGVDCEMCRTSAGINELTRISIVNEQYETVYETFVRPMNEIVDYLTRFSGITPELLREVTKRLPDVQKEVSELLPPDAILVGQSLQADLTAMQMMHPYVIDTSVCFNTTGIRRRKSKLKHLAQEFLQQEIQVNQFGHDSIEDSIACLRLVKKKLAHNFEFGDSILIEQKKINAHIKIEAAGKEVVQVCKRDKRTAIVHVGGMQERLKTVIAHVNQSMKKDSLKSLRLHEVETAHEAVLKVSEVALENALTITNVSVPPRDFRLESVNNTITAIDDMIDRLWHSVGQNGLFLVLMGGALECTNGVAKIAIKKNVQNQACLAESIQ